MISRFTMQILTHNARRGAARHLRGRRTIEQLEQRMVLAAGELDLSFGNGGLVTTDIADLARDETANDIAIQSDGKIVVVGATGINANGDGSGGIVFGPAGAVADIVVARYHPDGSLDNSFGTGGVITTDVLGRTDQGRAVAIQPDGKIVVGGSSDAYEDSRMAVVRYHADGTLDTLFGSSGITLIGRFKGTGGSRAVGSDMTIQTDGKIVIVGNTFQASTGDFAVARLNVDGSLDATFDDDGKLFTDFGERYEKATCVAIDSNGKIVVAGTSSNGSPGNIDIAISRYNSDGSLDLTFDSDGMVITDTGSGNSIRDVEIDSSGRIVVAGAILASDFSLARYHSNGSLDTSFDGDGIATASLANFDEIRSFLFDGSGRIVATGVSDLEAGVVRFNADGTLDSTFDGDGRVVTDFAGGSDIGMGIALQPDGNIVIAGRALQANTGHDIALARYVATDTPAELHGLVWEDFNDNSAVDFGEKAISGVTVILTGVDSQGNAFNQTVVTDADGVYMFIDVPPGTYEVSETQPPGLVDGKDVLGTVDGIITGVNGTNDVFSGIVLSAGSLAENYNFGERPEAGGAVSSGQTATIGFWQNNNGQALLASLGGDQNSTQLGDWLSATFPNMYGTAAGENDLTGMTNVQVADFYSDLFRRKKKEAISLGLAGPTKVDAQVMAVAFATYVTNETLAGDVAEVYGFVVTQHGVGTATYNVGDAGQAFDVTDYSDVTVLDLLLATDAHSTDGALYDEDGDGDADDDFETLLRTLANDVFSTINEQGDL